MEKTGKGFWSERLGLDTFSYPIPENANEFGYMLGYMTLCLFIIQGITGLILGLYYEPTVEGANASIAAISSDAFLGFVRSLHWWAANFIPLLILLHVLRIVIVGAYKKPREITWVAGVIMGFLAIVGSFYTGTILKWDQEGYEAFTHIFEASAPLGLEPLLADVLHLESLSAIFFVHVYLFPMIILLFFGLHALLIKIHGITELPGAKGPEESELTFIDHIKKGSIYGFGFFIFLSILSIILPQHAAPAPVYGAELELTYPPWIFAPLIPLEILFGDSVVIVVPTIIALILLAWPFIDKDPERDVNKGLQRILFWILILLIFAIFVINLVLAFVPLAGY